MNETILTTDSPQIIAPPPLIYLSGLTMGIVLHWIRPLPFLPGNLALPLGVVFVVISIALIVTAMRAFVKAKTNIDPRKSATSIVSTGPYRFSRNPIYLSMTLLTVGIAMWVNTLWILIALVLVLLIMQFGVIAREETYLARKFGEEYLQYKLKVHRWL
ncbi:MAG: isoprenylcysteine carboxylmethyltransferase family protein [Patescibacteria group bacterium]|nr:isoprenylcysteine carboxylmethyltransferase family protein [Patescibacteria group bacterium]